MMNASQPPSEFRRNEAAPKTGFDVVNGAAATRLKLAIRGAVQGVGFRPFVFRLANELKLAGWVNNSTQGVFIEAEGARSILKRFLLRLDLEKPPRSFIHSLEASWLDAVGYKSFEIRASENAGEKTALILPDIAPCPDCLRELFDPKNRRHLYPFINCAHCGPRFSIIESLPYDRANTSMNKFALCPDCRREYEDPADRRFHAQPNACPVCGPHLELWNGLGEKILANQQALLGAVRAIWRGKIAAVKGVGGFHLLADARNEKAVQRLRDRKHREEKPLALLFPSIEWAKAVCEISPLEERLMRSPETPIVLLRRRAQTPSNFNIAGNVAPGNPNLGVMLPSNPLHHLLMARLPFPVVATSGNLTDEPICTDEHEALERLGAIADVFLVHDRPIIRHLDDSIVRVVLDREMVLRRARGYAPLPITLNSQISTLRHPPIIAVGANLKNSVALAVGNQVFVSQHIGDLETEPGNNAFRRVIADFEKLYGVEPKIAAADLHPDYLSTRYVRESKFTRRVGVQHHLAHVLSCMAENEIESPALGVSWDGTGWGMDGTIWGGEFFLVGRNTCERMAHFRRFRLPGGEAAIKEPRRAALGLLFEMFGDAAWDMTHLPPFQHLPAIESSAIKGMLQRRLNSPPTSSAGRLFDAVASLIGLRQTMRFEGQAAMDLEFALDGIETAKAYNLPTADGWFVPNEAARFPSLRSGMALDWQPMIEAILLDLKNGVPAAEISAKFHNALANAIVAVAKSFGLDQVVISGGCFQNRYLTERVVRRLREENFKPYWHQRVPPNDGGIALGQVMAALREQRKENPQ